MINKELKEYIESEVLPRYDAFDKAHDRSHADVVIAESLELASGFPELDVNMVYAVAAYHDTGLVADRKTHHMVSGEIIMADGNLRRWFTEDECRTMKEAVEDHRASTDREPRSMYGRIVAEADRMIDTETVLRRTVQYGQKHYPEMDKEAHWHRFCEHLREKYAPGGYMKLWFAESKNALRLRELQSVIANEKELRSWFEKLYLPTEGTCSEDCGVGVGKS